MTFKRGRESGGCLKEPHTQEKRQHCPRGEREVDEDGRCTHTREIEKEVTHQKEEIGEK